MDQSVVRRGNHFIRLEGEWCLIDGPWFDYLSRLSYGGSMPVRFDCLDLPSTYGKLEDVPVWRDFRYIEWLPKIWHPGFRNPWNGKTWLTAQEMSLRDRWNSWIFGRRRIGYVLLPNGELPAFLSMEVPDGADRNWWWEALDLERGLI
jgi:hypothetical protein